MAGAVKRITGDAALKTFSAAAARQARGSALSHTPTRVPGTPRVEDYTLVLSDACRLRTARRVLKIEHQSLCSGSGIPHSMQIRTLRTGPLCFNLNSLLRKLISFLLDSPQPPKPGARVGYCRPRISSTQSAAALFNDSSGITACLDAQSPPEVCSGVGPRQMTEFRRLKAPTYPKKGAYDGFLGLFSGSKGSPKCLRGGASSGR
jgi:hypothetical protein